MRTPPTSSARLLCYLAITLIVFAVAASIPASAVSGAAFTTFDASQGGCLDGSHPNGINCNNYAHKEDVYMNGGPTAGGIAPGNYYFTVLAPGSQNGGFIDFAPGNLTTGSSGECGGGTGSPATQPSDRSFTKNADGTITNTGTHANGTDPQPEPVIQLAPYCDTPNMGGVYILAICEIGATAPSQCKYDAFKIKKQECTTDCGGASQATLSVCKFWDQNADHIWDNGEPFIGAWPITATNVDTVGGPVGTFTSDTINDSANPSFGCVTFTHTFADGETFADVTLSEGNAPDPTASPASQSCDASLTCQSTPSGPWTQSAPFLSNAVQPTETITLKPGDNLNADNFGNYIAATAPGVSKTALGGYTDTFTWTITKSVDKTTVETSGSTATFNYTITVTHDAGTVTGVNVGGIITVTNSNVDSHGNVVHINIDGITDQLSDGTTCSVTSGGAQTLTLASTTFAYTCSLSALPSSSLTNTVTVSWSTQSLSNGATLVGGSNPYTSGTITFTPTLVNGIATITDTFKGTLGVINAFTDTESGTGIGVTVGHPSSGTWTFSYSRVITVTPGQCKSYDNTATITETGQNSSETVTVCGMGTGALTMGFWKNTNGQKIITSYCGGTSGTSLYTFLTGYNPYKDLSSSTCSKIATYVSGVISAATCSSSSKTCNTMLRAQMLATALDVYFSDPSLGGDKIAAYNGGNTTSLGPVAIDLSHVCNMTDGSTGSTCTGVYEDARPEFGIVSSCLGTTVSQMLGYANANFPSSPNGDPVATATSGATWYKQIKSRQVIGKDGFDNINNQIANIDAGTVCSPSF